MYHNSASYKVLPSRVQPIPLVQVMPSINFREWYPPSLSFTTEYTFPLVVPHCQPRVPATKCPTGSQAPSFTLFSSADTTTPVEINSAGFACSVGLSSSSGLYVGGKGSWLYGMTLNPASDEAIIYEIISLVILPVYDRQSLLPGQTRTGQRPRASYQTAQNQRYHCLVHTSTLEIFQCPPISAAEFECPTSRQLGCN
jgi:hypothetical protein